MDKKNARGGSRDPRRGTKPTEGGTPKNKNIPEKGTLEYKAYMAAKKENDFQRRKRYGALTPEEIEKYESENDVPLWKAYPDFYAKKRTRKGRFWHGVLQVFLVCCIIFGIIGVVGIGAVAAYVYSYTDEELVDMLGNQDLSMSSVIYVLDENGNYVEYQILSSTENRSWIRSDEIPDCVKNAVVAIEDKRFYLHAGVDPITTFKAGVNYVFAKITGKSGNLAGGSTITQQLVKNITGDNEASGMEGIKRKIREALRALYLERIYSKEQILEYYLNTVFFGNNCNGISTAARYYFDKDPSELTTVEAAAIVAITKSPTYYDPYINPDNNRVRRNQILYEMYTQGYITSEAEYQEYLDTDIELRDRNAAPDTAEETPDTAADGSDDWSYATDTVVEAVVSDLQSLYNISREQALNRLYTGGLRIYSTIDLEIQQIMENYLSDESNYSGGNYSAEYYEDEETGERIYPEVAMEVMDPETGNILGVVGGRGEKTGKLTLNRVTQAPRQPGSAIKPLTVYGYAMENNIITAGSPVDDFPVDANIVSVNGSDITYRNWPVNYDGTYGGIIDVYKGLSYSLNTASVRVLDMIGVKTSYEFAKTMLGLKSLVSEDMQRAPLSTGSLTNGVTVQEMTGAYTVYANGGVYTAPRCYTRVENYLGDIILEKTVDKRIVFSEQTTYIMTDILKEVCRVSGTGRAALVSGVETAGKTGTTSNFYDRWFIGYTPYYLAGIWWGYDINHELHNSISWHTRLWGGVMNEIHAAKGYTSGEFEMPSGIVRVSYCVDSGKLPCEYCSQDQRGSRVKTGYFKAGTEPTETCDMHHALYVCSVSGQIAHENCPNATLKVFVDYVRVFPMRIRVSDAEYMCPRLTADMVLYNDPVLPVYYGSYAAGTYPGIPSSSKSRYANCLCTVHTPSATPHIYGTGTSSEESAETQ